VSRSTKRRLPREAAFFRLGLVRRQGSPCRLPASAAIRLSIGPHLETTNQGFSLPSDLLQFSSSWPIEISSSISTIAQPRVLWPNLGRAARCRASPRTKVTTKVTAPYVSRSNKRHLLRETAFVCIWRAGGAAFPGQSAAVSIPREGPGWSGLDP
jgi:hypothetical protein